MDLEPLDLTNLENVLKTHAYDFQVATEDFAKLRSIMTAQKASLERIEGKTYLNLRKALESEGAKFTETKLSYMVHQQPEYIKAFETWLQARENYDAVDNLREVFMQREMSIKSLVSLYNSQYWSLAGVTQEVTMKTDEPSESRFKTAAKDD